jgi:uncharacterized protein
MAKAKRSFITISAGAVLMAAACLWAYGLFESGRIELSHPDGQDLLPRSALKGMTAVHLSDLHISKMGKFEEEILDLVRSIDPDIIFLTGDYVSWDGDYTPALGFLSRLKAKVGIWAVLGDYDYSNSRKSCSFCHAREDRNKPNLPNVRFLRNACETLQTPSGDVSVCGVDSQSPGTIPGFEKALGSAAAGPVVLLSHSPLQFGELNTERETLVLAGDTHGGQVALPEWFFALLGYEKNIAYSQGLFTTDGKTMYVSRGLGTSHVPIRIGRKPEIVVIKF